MRPIVLTLFLATTIWSLDPAIAQERLTAPLAGTLPPPVQPDAVDRAAHGRQRVFISPMGEPFRSPEGGTNPIDLWFQGADANHDGMLTHAEFEADAARFFATLDREHDGEIDPDDIEVYENAIAPEIRVGGYGGGSRAGGRQRGGGGGGRRGGGGGGGHRGGGGRSGGEGGSDSAGGEKSAQPDYDSLRQGAARYGFFSYPEPITVADTDFNRGVSLAEFQAAADARFRVLDTKGHGRIARGDLPQFDPPIGMGRRPRNPGDGDFRRRPAGDDRDAASDDARDGG